jgi:hypothetical protein
MSRRPFFFVRLCSVFVTKVSASLISVSLVLQSARPGTTCRQEQNSLHLSTRVC